MGIAVASEAAVRQAQAHRSLRYLRGAVYWLAVGLCCAVLLAIVAAVGARLFGYSPCIMYGGVWD